MSNAARRDAPPGTYVTHHASRGLGLGLGDDFRRSLDTQLVHTGAQGARPQAQNLRGAGRTFDAPTRAVEDLADVIALDVDERSEPAALSRYFLDVERLADEPRQIEGAL